MLETERETDERLVLLVDYADEGSSKSREVPAELRAVKGQSVQSQRLAVTARKPPRATHLAPQVVEWGMSASEQELARIKVVAREGFVAERWRAREVHLPLYRR